MTPREQELLDKGHGRVLGSCGHVVRSCRCTHGSALVREVLDTPCPRCLAGIKVDESMKSFQLMETTMAGMMPALANPLSQLGMDDAATRMAVIEKVRGNFPNVSTRALEKSIFGNNLPEPLVG